MHIEGLDELDNKILSVIKDNARLSYKYIGEQVGRYLKAHFAWVTNTLTKKPIPTYND